MKENLNKELQKRQKLQYRQVSNNYENSIV